MRKRKTDFVFPNGHPYMLFNVKAGKDSVYAIAATEQQAIRISNFNKAKALPLSIKSVIDDQGHRGANKFLRQFGDTWVCRSGKVFYKSP